eukprot:g8686.t1
MPSLRPLSRLLARGFASGSHLDFSSKVIADFCVVPITGKGVSVRNEVAIVEKTLREYDGGKLKCSLHAYGTNVEGPWDAVMGALKACHAVLHEHGVPRVSTTVKIGTRIDKTQTMADKHKAIQDAIKKL